MLQVPDLGGCETVLASATTYLSATSGSETSGPNSIPQGTFSGTGSVSGPSLPDESPEEAPDAWRDELSARLGRYRARRRMPPPRYPSLSLPFGRVDSSLRAKIGRERSSFPPFEPVSDQALALDEMRMSPAAANSEESARQTETQPHVRPSAKIIEFPRSAWGPPSWTPTPAPANQLAEPVSDLPRILEVPETAPAAPALGGITIEAAEREEAEKRPGFDLPLKNATLPRRILASAVDGLIVAAASALFGFIFWKVAAIRPPLFQILAMAAAIPCLVWFAYQYLLIVYAGRTPGLQLAGLELTRFDGSATTRSLRRLRVLASYLSAASLGMGYAWVLLDEDILCWHDRITHTYLAPAKKTAAAGR